VDLDSNWLELQAFSEAFKSFIPAEIAVSSLNIREFNDISNLGAILAFLIRICIA
jgi:hypothetical protein